MAGRAKRRGRGTWDAGKVRALRRHLGVVQRQLADYLGTRQQTVSEWETGLHRPRGASVTLLSMIAEQAAFYDAAAVPDRPPPEEEEEASPKGP